MCGRGECKPTLLQAAEGGGIPAPPILDHHTPAGGPSVCLLGTRDFDLITISLIVAPKIYFRALRHWQTSDFAINILLHFSVFDTLQSQLLKWSLYLSNQSGWNLEVAVRFPVSQVRSGHLGLWWRFLLLFAPDCCSLIFLLCALDSTAGFLPSVPGRGVLACVWAWIPAHIVILGLRVVKLAETDAAACCFPWLQHSSPDEGWVQAKPAALPCGPDFLFVSLLLSFLCWNSPLPFLHTCLSFLPLQVTPWWSWWRACPMEPWIPF